MQTNALHTKTDPATSASAAAGSAAAEKPLVIELRQTEKQANGTFRPQASLKLTPALRTSGLLLALPGEDLKNLLFLMSFLTPNGDCIAALPQLAAAMRISAMKVRTRMHRLLEFKWQGEPLVILLHTESGLDTYTLNTRFVAYEHTEEPVPEPPVPAYRAAGWEAIIAHSRAHYARPRAAVERLIAEQNGWPLPDEVESAAGGDAAVGAEEPRDSASGTIMDTENLQPPAPEPQSQAPEGGVTASPRPRAHVKQQLLRLGIAADLAEELLSRFDLVRIQRQLRWLKYRKAKNPAGFLVAAIEDDYEAPAVLWHRARQPVVRHPPSAHRLPHLAQVEEPFLTRTIDARVAKVWLLLVN